MIIIVLLFIVLSIVIGLVLHYNRHTETWDDVCGWYNLPRRSVCFDGGCSNQLSDKFRNVIEDAMMQTTDADQLYKLQECLHSVRGIEDIQNGDVPASDDIHRAFKYTGCHIRIEDNSGKIIAEFI